MNKHGLSRTIDSGTKLAIRQRCGFGCIFCGLGIIQYHHFMPEFKDAITHDPGSAPSSGVTQEVLGPFLEGEQEQSGG